MRESVVRVAGGLRGGPRGPGRFIAGAIARPRTSAGQQRVNQCCRDRSLVDGAIGDRDRVGELRQVAFRGGRCRCVTGGMRGWNRRGGSRSTVLGAAYPIREGGGERLKGGCRCQVKGLRHVGGSAFSGQIHT